MNQTTLHPPPLPEAPIDSDETVYSLTPAALRASQIVKMFPRLGEEAPLLWLEISKALIAAQKAVDDLWRANKILVAENRALKAQQEALKVGQP